MNWRSLMDVRTWMDRGTEVVWHSVARPLEATSISWPLEPDALRGVHVRWPLTYSSHLFPGWFAGFADGFKRFVPVEYAEVPQSFGMIEVEFVRKGKASTIAIDSGDYASRVNEDSLKRCTLYFKMNFLDGGYGDARVLPGGYIPFRQSLYRYLPYLRRLRDEQRFEYDVQARFGLEFSADVRGKAVTMLSRQDRFTFLGGTEKVRYSRFLREACRSRICIDLPGNADFCTRLVDYLAIGSCIIARQHRTKLLAPLVDRQHIVYMNDDLSDLLDLCDYYLRNAAERERLASNSRMYFDRYLHRQQLAAYYLTKYLDRVD